MYNAKQLNETSSELMLNEATIQTIPSYPRQ